MKKKPHRHSRKKLCAYVAKKNLICLPPRRTSFAASPTELLGRLIFFFFSSRKGAETCLPQAGAKKF
jgi:hypothetical protein